VISSVTLPLCVMRLTACHHAHRACVARPTSAGMETVLIYKFQTLTVLAHPL